ncbi:MAG: hypothetical protein KF819_27940 [Labilithrix sp.]|nr:hypothetical protein [Labilithrix sp.]
MKIGNVALVSVVVVLGAVTGCSARADGEDDGRLSESESLLISDADDANENEDTLEGAIEEPLSGADPSDPGSPADGDTDDAVMGKVRTNPGRWFKPAGCITTTIVGNVATHVFAGCTGPYGLVSFNGTITSTYERGGAALTVTHEATDFKVNGASVSGKRVVTYTRSGTTITRTRKGSWSGATKSGVPITHTADFTMTYDPTTKCITREGSGTTTIGGRELSIDVAGYKRCGVGSLGCPEGGTITLSRTKSENAASVTVEFLGGRQVRYTGPRGGRLTRLLICRSA